MSYYFTESTNRLYGQWFKMNEKDGTIKSIKKLDYERLGPSVILQVVAQDAGQLTSLPTNVTINIANLNDNVPTIYINLPDLEIKDESCLQKYPFNKQQKVFHTELMEILPENQSRQKVTNATRYFNLTVADLDKDDDNFVFCEVSNRSDDHIQLLQISENLYQVCYSCDFFSEAVFESKLFDRESGECHFIEVSCIDNGVPSLSSSVRLVISLSDLNDNPPSFEHSIYPFTIHTNNLCKSFEVGRVHARDRDKDANSKVGYTIRECSGIETSDHGRGDLMKLQKHIKVSSSRGVISMDLSDAGDCRQFSSILFRCELIARNREDPYFETSSLSYIYIEQTYKVHFHKSHQTKHMFILENQPILSLVGNLRSIFKTRQNLTFTILEGSTRDFKINLKTGDILTHVYLNRELRDTYRFSVKAELKTPREGRHSRITHLLIHVLDLNDNPPEFYKPKQDEVVTLYQEGVYARRKVYRVKARDKDVGRNSLISYKLLNTE